MTDLLRDALVGPDNLGLIQSATITAVYADGTVDVDLGADRIVAGCPVLAPYAPVVGAPVQLIRRDLQTWLVLGATLTTANTTVDVARSWGLPYAVLAQPTGSAAGDATGTLTVNAAAIASFRENEGWSKYPTAPLQGAYSTTWGYYRGLYFYGANAFASHKGRKITRARNRHSRYDHGGIAGGERQWLAAHAHATRPSSSPIFTSAATNVGTLAWSTALDFDLPLYVGQALADGRAKGIGHLYFGTADYSICKGLAADALSGRLILDWRS